MNRIALLTTEVEKFKKFNFEIGDGKAPVKVTSSEKTLVEAVNAMLSKGNAFIMGFLGVAILISMIYFVYYVVMIGKNGNNPTKRSEMVTGALWALVGFGLFGSLSLVYFLAFDFFK